MHAAALGSIVLASLVGSLHCAGMCGGLVGMVAGAGPRQQAAQLAYHLARLAAYVVLGVTAALLGSAFDLAGTAWGLGRLAASVAGAAMVVVGVVTLLRMRERSGGAPVVGLSARAPSVGILARLSARLLRGLMGRSALARGLGLGLLSGVLPCGWLYAFVLGAGATASPWAGALVMTAFWAGTVPVLLGLGLGLQRLLGPVRRLLPRVTALGLVVAGLVTVLARGSVPEEVLGRVRGVDVGGVDALGDAVPSHDGPSCPFHGAETEPEEPSP